VRLGGFFSKNPRKHADAKELSGLAAVVLVIFLTFHEVGFNVNIWIFSLQDVMEQISLHLGCDIISL